jgi:tetratricopeptide (TPR) repeat protein
MSALPPYSPAAAGAAAQRIVRNLQRAEGYIGSGQLGAAAASIDSVLQADPANVPGLLYRAEIELMSGRNGSARQAVQRALAGNLSSPRMAIHLLRVLGSLSESGMMIDIVRQLPPPMWDSAKSLAEVAQELSVVGAYPQAREFARAAVARDPDHPPSLYVHATLDVFYGDMDAAAERCQRVLHFVPDDPGTHWLLSRLRLPGAGPRIDRIEALLAKNPGAEAQSWLSYGLHNELHEQKDYARSWAALERGCRAKRSTLRYTEASADALLAALRGWTAAEARIDDGFRSPTLRPVFVIGLHRSGTTLAERILSGHSQVSAGGETYDIRAQLRRVTGIHFPDEIERALVEHRAKLDYRAVGEGYLRGMAWRAAGKPVVTDKLPSNYYNLGFIARALPEARFIHLNRDPIDVGLSSLRTLFSHACPYSYDQHEYIAHYRRYQALMAHWRECFPERILDVAYDDLVNAPEATAARMAAFCGLDYQPAMLRIESREDAVATASSVMMRDGIRRDRGKVWKAYENQLAPMIAALGS